MLAALPRWIVKLIFSFKNSFDRISQVAKLIKLSSVLVNVIASLHHGPSVLLKPLSFSHHNYSIKTRIRS